MIVLVDAENVRRSTWPNIAATELVILVSRWAAREGVDAVVVFDGPAPEQREDVRVVGTDRESADDWIAREAAALARGGDTVRVVTSDRELRRRVEGHAHEIVGGGSFARTLRS